MNRFSLCQNLRRTLYISLITMTCALIHVSCSSPGTKPSDITIDASNKGYSEPVRILIEAEDTLVTSIPEDDRVWSVKEFEGAQGGKVLHSRAGAWRAEKPTYQFDLPAAGKYRVWVRFHREKPVSPGFFLTIRDEHSEEIGLHFFDWVPVMPTDQPYIEKQSPFGEQTGWLWESFDMMVEHPTHAELVLGVYRTGHARMPDRRYTNRNVDCILITQELSDQPEQLLPAQPHSGKVAKTEPALPDVSGWVRSKGMSSHVDFFTGIDDHKNRFEAGLINNGSYYRDYGRYTRLGFNHDHGRADDDMVRHGIVTHGYVEGHRGDWRELGREYKSPEGRIVNNKGAVSRQFSYAFEPMEESIKSQVAGRVRAYLDGEYPDAVSGWRVTIEDGGVMDYSEYAQKAFRDWLKEKFGSIDALNKRWNASYESFDAIVPPASYEEGPACWLAFRDFSGKLHVNAVATQIPVIEKLDRKDRPMTGANSSLDLFAPFFMRFRPMDFDELIQTALKDEKYISWDTYCADDQLAAEVDLVASLAEDKLPVIQEWSNHITDARIAGRSYWTYVTKGCTGIYLFMMQEGIFHATYPKWGLLSQDRSPKDKFAAYADAAHEVHRIEPLLMEGRPTPGVKPIALYWSRIDLSIAEPHDSLYGSPLNSPMHVYRTLRGLGYPIRFINPRQVNEGQLEDISALFLVGSKHIPAESATKIEQWVKAGGVVVGDSWPGGWDEYAQPQATLAPVFGVRKQAPKQVSETALLESTQGYGEVTDAAVVRKEHHTMVDEIAQQPSATHPVAKQVGDFMVSGIGPNRIDCFDGKVVGMSHRGFPGFVINDYGKGQAFYSSLLLGTIYESGGTRYEWDTTHSGLAYARILDIFLKFAGVQPQSVITGPTERVISKLRVEAPIVTGDGNVTIGLTSMNDAPVGAFDLTVTLPDKAAPHFTSIYFAKGGTRELTKLTGTRTGNKLQVTIPGFDSTATVLALHDSDPLIAMSIDELPTAIADIPTVGTDQTFTVNVIVHNPSPRTLKAGAVKLYTPEGWLQSATLKNVGSIAPGQSKTCSFKVTTLSIAAAKRLKPIVLKYDNGQVKSMPCTQLLWWGLEQ